MGFWRGTAGGASGIAALLVSAPLVAAPGTERKVACGAPRTVEEVFFLRKQRLAREPRLARRIQDPLPASRDVNGIAVLDTSSGVLTPPNPFDLSLSRVRITSRGDGFKIDVISGGPAPGSLERGLPLALDDEDFAVVELPFLFPYFGSLYRTAYVHSDGNITFLHPEASSVARSLSRALSGPPRIAPLFKDLDPSRAGQVRLDSQPDRVVVSWHRVSVFVEHGIGPRQSVQTVLHADGGIEFLYGELTVTDAVVGIFPGELAREGDAVDWSLESGTEIDGAGALAEIFTSERAFDEFAAALSFYRNHDDAYDTLIVFNDLGLDASAFSLAHAYNVRNEVRGIGEFVFDSGSYFGSPRRLSAFVNMGAVSGYPSDPSQPLPGLPHASLLTILAHEIGHRFLAYPSFLDPATGLQSLALLGRQLAHWSFFFNSGASVLEGNWIRDHGPSVNPRFETVAATENYSAFDQYLMGLRAPSEVPATFLVEHPRSPMHLGSAARSPQVGVEFHGQRKDIRVEDIVAWEGARRPDTTVSQRHFRFAFVLLVEDADSPDPATLKVLEKLRAELLTYFESQLGGRAVAAASLVNLLQLSTWPAGGVIARGNGRARVSISGPRESDLPIQLSVQDGIASVPSVVTIPAGDVHAEFSVAGLESGTTTLVAETSEIGYDRAVTRLAVRDGLEGLMLEAEHPPVLHGLAGRLLHSPLVFRLRDENLVPYSGVTLEYKARAPGSPGFVNSVTDVQGRARIRWPLGDTAGVQTLVARVKGAPEVSAVTEASVALARPSFQSVGIVNFASQQGVARGGGFAPGSLLTVFGSRLSTEVRTADGLGVLGAPALPRELVGTQAYVNGAAAPLLHVSPSQVNFQVPFEVPGPWLRIVVATPFGASYPVTVRLVTAQPGIFPDRIVGERRPAAGSSDEDTAGLPQAGGRLVVFCTGLGAVSPPGRTGLPGWMQPPQQVLAPTEAWVDERPVQVTFAGLTTAEVGVYAVLLDLPENLGSGVHMLRIAVDGQPSNLVRFKSR